jgi:hypothetical protein
MKGSGNQILTAVLKDLATRRIPKAELRAATDNVRAALLWHGSSSEDNFRRAQALQWASSYERRRLVRQGLAVQKGQVHLLDLFERMLEMPGLEDFTRNAYDGLSKEDYDAAVWGLWCLLSVSHMYTERLPVQAADDAELELEKWIDNMKGKYKYSFENDQVVP